MIIRYTSAPCGSGKTTAIIDKCAELISNSENVVLCQPTTLLIDETLKQLQAKHPHVHVIIIHKKIPKIDKVVAAAQRALLHPCPETPTLLMITIPCLLEIKFVPALLPWHLIIDEAPHVNEAFAKNLPDTHDLLTRHLITVKTDSPYDLLIAKNMKEVSRISRNERKRRRSRSVQKTRFPDMLPNSDYIYQSTHF